MYYHVLEKKNRNSVATMITDEDDHFLYFFIALEPCIRGFRNAICFVIAIDGTFFKDNYQNTLFVATVQNENGRIYPVTSGIVDSKNDAS